MCEGRESEGGEQKLQVCRRFGQRHPVSPFLMRTDQWNDRLYDCHRKGENEREVSKFCNHAADYRA